MDKIKSDCDRRIAEIKKQQRRLEKWNVKNIVAVINALMQKMKAIQSVSGATKNVAFQWEAQTGILSYRMVTA